MLRLTAASALLNYLPMRPGLLGRAAYLKARHGLGLKQSFVILIITLAVGASVMAVTAALMLIDMGAVWRYAALLIAMIAMSAASPWIGRIAFVPGATSAWRWIIWRLVDLFVTALRLWLAFGIIDQPVPFDFALLCAAGSAFAAMLPLSPNGLGLSEWVVAGLAEISTVIEGPAGLAAKLIDRVVEAVVITAVGAVAIVSLKR